MRWFLLSLLSLAAGPLHAGDIMIQDAFARVARPGAPSGAVFMTIHNMGETADRLIGAESPIAARVELHTHIEDDGVMRMRPIEGGIELPAGEMHELARGGDHVMLMGITEEFEEGSKLPLTLIFENQGEMPLTVTIDNSKGQSGHKN